MYFKQFYLGCLSHASYYIGSGTEAAIIDPQRDVQQYIEEAASHGQQIKYIIETHSHADFVSGHVELAAKTGAEIVYGQRANTQFPTHKVSDGDELHVGAIALKFLETPGHTPEGITIVATDTEDPSAPQKMFTGDTLFIGDVGRPDLIGSKGFTAEQMGGMLYDSLHEKILTLPDETEVYPAHGAGSLCGKSLSKETWSTLGNQRKFNYALQPMTKEQFVKIVAADQPEVPAYFPKSAAKNLEGSAPLTDLAKPQEFSTEEIQAFDGVVIDIRQNLEYGEKHIPNSINIGLGGQFASWAGTLVPIGTPIAIVADNETQVDEACTRLARVGHETVTGFILLHNYKGETKSIEQVSVNEVSELTQTEKYLQFVDVRRPAEHAAGHADRTINIPLDRLAVDFDKLDPNTPTYVICQGGYRSSLGTSILENAGFRKIFNVTGGTAAWIEAGLETKISATACANSK
ncbi:MAG TPA: rhodanese-like domain-containing protein [Pyrinomonadaceae bacterium]|nr:MBL fold metallo-hydrolase [Acidobacteriota bacterium]HQZ97971.1 rhodanese-like domain-containing protein [Pyrinomonadaceae bacterium]